MKSNTDKVDVIKCMSEPRKMRKVRNFVSVIGYYRRFIPGFFMIATTLISLRNMRDFDGVRTVSVLLIS